MEHGDIAYRVRRVNNPEESKERNERLLLIVQMFLARWTIDVRIISLELTVSGEGGDGKRVGVERGDAPNLRTRSPAVTCLSARTLQIATVIHVTADILALLPHPVSFQ